jgi:alpha-amylase/alpha-mannosidase (GH57 family)
MLNPEELIQAAQTLVSDEQLADYFGVDVEVIREEKNYFYVKRGRAKTIVFLRNNLLSKATSGDKNALDMLNKQVFG